MIGEVAYMVQGEELDEEGGIGVDRRAGGERGGEEGVG